MTRPLPAVPARNRLPRFGAVLVVLLLCMPRVSAAAPAGATSPAPVTPTPAGPTDQFDRSVPRGALRDFLDACATGDYERAAATLDLRRLPPAARQTGGRTLARELGIVLDRTVWFDFEQVSDKPEGDLGDRQPPRREWVGVIQSVKGPVEILLERLPREDGTLIWKISAATVAKVPELYEEFGYGPLERFLPAPFFEIRLLQIQLWQWIGLLLAIGVAWIVSWVLTRWLVRIGQMVVRRSRTQVDDQLLHAAVGPLRLTIAVLVYFSTTFALALSIRSEAIVGGFAKLLTIVAVTWMLLRLVDLVAQMTYERLATRRGVALDLVPLGRRIVKVFIAVVALIGALQNLGINVTGLIAGLGIGGLAVALAAQKTVENLFGSVTIIADQPVRVGDLCRFGDKAGTVEDIGLRSTRVRTLDRTVLSVPNGEFAAMQIENLSRRDRFWLQTTIGLPYDTKPQQLRDVLTELRKALASHPKVEAERARIRLIGFGAAGYRVELCAAIIATGDNEFAAIREEVFLQAMDIVSAAGTRIAAS